MSTNASKWSMVFKQNNLNLTRLTGVSHRPHQEGNSAGSRLQFYHCSGNEINWPKTTSLIKNKEPRTCITSQASQKRKETIPQQPSSIFLRSPSISRKCPHRSYYPPSYLHRPSSSVRHLNYICIQLQNKTKTIRTSGNA